MKRVLLLVVLISGVCAAQNRAAVLLKADREFARAVAEKGLEGWMSFMAEDAVLLRLQPVVGHEAVRNTMQKAFSDPNVRLTWTPTRGEIFKSGDLGYTVGRFEASRVNDKGERITTRGTYLTVWKKQTDGSWKVIWDGGDRDPVSSKRQPSPAKEADPKMKTHP